MTSKLLVSISALDNGVITFEELHESLVFYYNCFSLDSGINVETIMNVGPGKLVKENKRSVFGEWLSV